ncbi:SapB/AmfS family lanthipeptide [Kitasatospora sp. RB6PN24]|nr:SapB/AmfS family lanthipeptide [Kitasatospora humi]MCC9309545.1 SapB/AmfS family lanthipeptide [Kitasatospora humi]
MEILELQALETPAEETDANEMSSTLSVVNCGNSTVSTLLCL